MIKGPPKPRPEPIKRQVVITKPPTVEWNKSEPSVFIFVLKSLIVFVVIVVLLLLFYPKAYARSEREIVDNHCKGKIEYVLPDRTRCDCLTDKYAIEYDFVKKWYEAIGQSLHYSRLTGKLPGVVLIKRKKSDLKHIKSCEKLLDYLYKKFGLKIYLWVLTENIYSQPSMFKKWKIKNISSSSDFIFGPVLIDFAESIFKVVEENK